MSDVGSLGVVGGTSAGEAAGRRARADGTLPASVADWIESGIIRGLYPEGSRIREVEVASQFGVSRAPVREALSILARRGLVRLVPRIGAVSCGLSEATIREVYETRAILEAELVRKAVPRLSVAQVAELERLLASIQCLTHRHEWERVYETAWIWRETLYGASGNTTGTDVVRRLRARLSTVPHALRGNPEYVQFHNTFYKQATEAIMHRNSGAAASLVHAFLLQTGDQIAESFGTREQGRQSAK